MQSMAKQANIRPTAFLEAALGLAVLGAVNLIFFREDPGFTRLNLHPALLVVLLIAVRYGFRAGLWTGLAAGLAHFALTAVQVADPTLADLTRLDLWWKPLLFVGVGALFGEIRQAQMRALGAAVTERDELRRRQDNLVRRYKALYKAKQEIDSRIISQEQTLSTLYESAQALRSLREDQIHPAALNLLKDYLAVQECSLYMLEDEHLVLKAAITPPDAPLPEAVSRDQGMMGQALAERRTVSVNALLQDKLRTKEFLVCAPIMGAEGRRVIGLLNVRKMPFIKFTPEAIKMISLIADWTGASLENARLYQSTKEKVILDEILQAYTPEYLDKRLREEFLRARRYGLDLSLVYIEFPGFGGMDEFKREMTLTTFSLVLKNTTREIDLLFLEGEPGHFVLLLPNTHKEGCRAVLGHIRDSFDTLRLATNPEDHSIRGLRIGMAAVSDQYKTAEEMLGGAKEEASHAYEA